MSKYRRHLAFKSVAPAALVIWYNHQEGAWMDFSEFFKLNCVWLVESFFSIKKGRNEDWGIKSNFLTTLCQQVSV